MFCEDWWKISFIVKLPPFDTIDIYSYGSSICNSYIHKKTKYRIEKCKCLLAFLSHKMCVCVCVLFACDNRIVHVASTHKWNKKTIEFCDRQIYINYFHSGNDRAFYEGNWVSRGRCTFVHQRRCTIQLRKSQKKKTRAKKSSNK